tara:strand:- start:402 stop:836 length:435 start_codon:yes stop_codon:yes gene_type:complete
MFHKGQSPTDRLSAWRTVRQREYDSINDLLIEFKDIKILDRYLDYYTPSSWPNVFEIVNDGYFCQSGITLILFATLLHKGFISEGEYIVPVISNNITGTVGTVLKVDDLYYNFYSHKGVDKKFVEDNSVHFQTHKIHSNQLTSN